MCKLADFFALDDGVVETRDGAAVRPRALEEAAIATDGKVDAILGCAMELCDFVFDEHFFLNKG